MKIFKKFNTKVVVITLLILGLVGGAITLAVDLGVKTSALKQKTEEYNALEQEYVKKIQEHDVLVQKYANLEIELGLICAELEIIQGVYPLKYFPDEETLNNWIKAHIKPASYNKVESYKDALDIQRYAADDGWIISVEVNQYWWARLTALIGETLYTWLPEDERARVWEVLK